MERFFIVKNENLIEEVRAFESMKHKFNETFKNFAEEHGIETKSYYMMTNCLRICPTPNDSTKFGDQLKADGETFKVRSKMNKLWVELCKENNMITPYKPSWELADLIGGFYHFRCRLFSLDDEVYGSFEAERNFELPEEHFIELKGSEFYELIEAEREV